MIIHANDFKLVAICKDEFDIYDVLLRMAIILSYILQEVDCYFVNRVCDGFIIDSVIRVFLELRQEFNIIKLDR